MFIEEKETNKINESLNDDKNELNKNLINNDNINIDKIISLFIKYYKFENHLKDEIGENNIEVGYIIDRNELEQWKNKNYYNLIKKHFLDQSFKDNINKELPEETKERIFKYLESKVKNLYKIKSLHFNSIDDLSVYNTNNSFAIIKEELFNLMNENNEESNNKISFFF